MWLIAPFFKIQIYASIHRFVYFHKVPAHTQSISTSEYHWQNGVVQAIQNSGDQTKQKILSNRYFADPLLIQFQQQDTPLV